MMKDQENINIKINIAGEDVMLSVPFKDQLRTRDIEKEINTLFDRWRRSFPQRSEKALLAMIIYRYADLYRERTDECRRALEEAKKCISDLDSLSTTL